MNPTIMTISDLFVPLVAALALLLFLIVLIYAFLQARTIAAVTDVIKQFRANEGWMNAVESGITQTVPNEVVIEVMKRFDTIADLLTAFVPTKEEKGAVQAFKDLADQVTDGKPYTPPNSPPALTTNSTLSSSTAGDMVTSKPILALKREQSQQ